MTKEERGVILTIHRATGLKTPEKAFLSQTVDRKEDWLKWSSGDLEQVLGRKLRPGAWRPEVWISEARKDQEFLDQENTGILVWGTPGYPALLEAIEDPPFVVFYRGRLWTEGQVLGALVGTRQPSEEARKAAWDLGRDLTQEGVGVVSGLARGIDAAAHGGALEAGPTWAVLGCGIDQIYPPGHRTLGRRILQAGGGILSEYGVGIGPRNFRFPARNRIVSGLCDFTVVVQAPLKSGALITANLALEQGRDVMVHRRGLQGFRGEGSHFWAFSGAPVIETAREVLDCWKMN